MKWIHIVAGLLSLLAGFTALYAAKGGDWHRRAGTVFFGAMLVMASSVTSSPAAMAACSESAPTVSAATSGTSFHPMACIPCSTPLINPPPPTDSTTASGLGICAAASSIIVA